MPTRQESRRGLQEEYVTGSLRLPSTQLIVDPEKGTGYTLSLKSASPPSDVQLEVYPDSHTLVLRTALFTLACNEVTDVRRLGSRLRFVGTTGSRRVGITVSRQGDIDVRYRDTQPQPSHWQQGLLNRQTPSDAS
jgi:hypothetical protein